ncbi:MAG: type II secretion system major pseudopilin GspG [Candidatus Accumulibacter sp.]|nr:type II secretion system major pseudopilin GspG [Accumulibacter sp.]
MKEPWVFQLGFLFDKRSNVPRFIQSGFTLLELMVVVAIIGLLAGYVAPRYFSQLSKSERQTAQAQIQAFEKALDQYRLDTGHYPRTDQGLKALVVRSESEPKWNGPYLQKDPPPDPWGNPYNYRNPGTKREVDIVSYGNDGKPGGECDAADIAN